MPSLQPKTDDPATSTRPGLDGGGRRVRLDAAVHLQLDVRLDLVDHLPDALDLSQVCSGMNSWPPKPGLTVITSTRSTSGRTSLELTRTWPG